MSVFRVATVLMVCLAVCSAEGKGVRTLELYGFETPLYGKMDPSWPGGRCEGKLVRLAEAAHDGSMGGRLYFNIPKDFGGFVTWNYSFPSPIQEGAKSFSVWVRPNQAKGTLLFQLSDKDGWIVSGQPVPAVGRWTKITLDLDKAEYSERKEKKPAWPITMFSVGMQGTDGAEGYLDLDSLTVMTDALPEVQPPVVLELVTERFGNLYPSGEIPGFTLFVRRLNDGDPLPGRGTFTVTDWQGQKIYEGNLDGLKISGKGVSKVPISVKELKGSGAFCLTVKIKTLGENTQAYSTHVWFGILPVGRVAPISWVGTCMPWTHGWGMGEMRVVDIAEAAGIGSLRMTTHWPSIERSKGQYRPMPTEERFIDELKRRGIICNMHWSHANPIYSNPLDPDGHARFAAWLAEHYKGRVDHFEIWNEAANTVFRQQYGWDNTGRGPWVTKFVEFTNKAVGAMKAVRPDATVLVAAEDVFFRLQEMLEKGIGKGADVIAIHTYTKRPPRPEMGEFLGDGLKALREYSQKYGGPQRVAITEAGWTTCAGSKVRYLDWAGSFEKTTYPEQAAYLIRMYLLARAANVEYALNYDFKDDGPHRDYTEHNFGLIHEDNSPKPSLIAVAALTRIIGNGKFVRDLSAAPEKYRMYLFNVKGKPVLAIWAVQGKSKVRLEINAKQVEQVDLMGNVQNVPVRDQKLDIVLTEVPVYLRGSTIDRVKVQSLKP